MQLTDEVLQAKNQVVDNLESERNHTEDKVIALQLTMKVKDEQIMSLQHEIKIFE